MCQNDSQKRESSTLAARRGLYVDFYFIDYFITPGQPGRQSTGCVHRLAVQE